MKKGQSFVVQFILFFLISFSMFSVISYFFYSQNLYYEEIVGKHTSELINDVISTNIIKKHACKGYTEVFISQDIPSRIAGSFYNIELNDKGVKTTVFIGKHYSELSNVFNLNSTYFLFGESVSENKKAEILINNTNNSIRVS